MAFSVFSDIPKIDKQGFRTFLLTSFGKIFGPFSYFRKGTPVAKKCRNENVPKYSSFGYRFSRYIFPKLYRIPKLLPKRMALMCICVCMCASSDGSDVIILLVFEFGGSATKIVSYDLSLSIEFFVRILITISSKIS